MKRSDSAVKQIFSSLIFFNVLPINLSTKSKNEMGNNDSRSFQSRQRPDKYEMTTDTLSIGNYICV